MQGITKKKKVVGVSVGCYKGKNSMGTTIRPKKKTPKSRIKWGLSLARGSLSPSPHLLLSFMLLFSSLCCSPFRAIAFLRCFFYPTILLIVLLLSFSLCYSFSSHCLAFLFTLLFALLCFSHCDVVVGVL